MANYQYSVADVIGIQTQGNQAYFADRPDCMIEVLQNWLADAPNLGCSIDVAGGTKNTQDMDCHGAEAPRNDGDSVSSLRAERGNPGSPAVLDCHVAALLAMTANL